MGARRGPRRGGRRAAACAATLAAAGTTAFDVHITFDRARADEKQSTREHLFRQSMLARVLLHTYVDYCSLCSIFLARLSYLSARL